MAEEEAIKRPPGRPSRDAKVREFTSRLGKERTAKYGDPSEDWSYIPPEAIPDGCEVQWNVHFILGQPVQPHEIQKFTMNGWEAFPLDLYPNLMPDDMQEGNIVQRNGQVLYVRRKELGDEARAEELYKARDAMRRNKEELGMGSLHGDSTAPRVKPKFKENYEAIPISE